MCNVDHVSHSYHTRKRNLSIVVPQVKTQGRNTFKYCAIKLWNELPHNIKSSQSKDDFKRKCKSFLMNKMEQVESSEFTV